MTTSKSTLVTNGSKDRMDRRSVGVAASAARGPSGICRPARSPAVPARKRLTFSVVSDRTDVRTGDPPTVCSMVPSASKLVWSKVSGESRGVRN